MTTFKVGDTVLVVNGLEACKGFNSRFFNGKGKITRETKTRWEVEIVNFNGEVTGSVQFRKDNNCEYQHSRRYCYITEYKAEMDTSAHHRTDQLLTYRCCIVGDLSLRLQNSMRSLSCIPTNDKTMPSILEMLTCLGSLGDKLEEAIVLIDKTVNDHLKRGE